MTSTTPPRTFDADALRRAFADQDAEALLALYAPDATQEIADAAHPPSAPTVRRGHAELRAAVEDVFSRDMTHELAAVVVGPDAIAYTLRCRYPDGTRVLCSATARLRDGLIAEEVGVQAWDS